MKDRDQGGEEPKPSSRSRIAEAESSSSLTASNISSGSIEGDLGAADRLDEGSNGSEKT